MAVKENGYWSVIELCASLTSIIRIERPLAKGDWLLYDARIPKKETPEPQESHRSRHTSEPSNSVVKETLRQVLQCFPKGIPMNDLPDIYKKLTGETLPIEEMGFRTLAKFLISLADSVLNIEYTGAGCIMIYGCSNGEPRKTDLLKRLPDPEPAPAIGRVVPEDAVGPGTYYTPNNLPKLYEYREVFVSNIVSPSVFWIQLCGKKTTTALEKIMDELERIYKSAEGESYKIPDEFLVKGLCVVAIFPEDDNWHRCTITGLHTGHMIEIYFVDYGNTCTVHKKTLRLLKSKLLKLPAQAIQARLGNIRPAREQWTIEARNRMLGICTNKRLIAYPIAEKDRVLSLCLTDTTDRDVDVHLNDLLANEGYALFYADDASTDFAPLNDSQVPDYGYIYGTGMVQPPSTTNVAPNIEPDIDQAVVAASPGQGRHYIQEIQMNDRVIHVFNVDSTGYMMSSEVSGFFWDADVVTSMLERKKAGSNVKKLKICKDDYPELFEELQLNFRIEKRNKDSLLTLYELKSVPFILDLFGSPSEQLYLEFLEIIQNFDPESEYWKGDEDVETSSNTQTDDDDYECLDYEELRLTLQALQFKRKRILQTMLIGPTDDIVNELNQVEDQIAQIKENIEEVQARRALGPEEDVVLAVKPEKSKGTTSATGTTKTQDTAVPKMEKTAVSTGAPIKLNVVAPMQNKTPSKTMSQPAQTTSSATVPSVNSNLMNTLAQQQLMYQSMMLGQTIPGFNPSLLGAQSVQPQISQQYLGNFGNQSMPGLNPQLPVMMQASMMSPFMQNPLAAQLSQPAPMQNFQGFGRGSSLPGNMTLLPGLLPLLQNLNVNPQGEGQDPTSKQNSQK